MLRSLYYVAVLFPMYHNVTIGVSKTTQTTTTTTTTPTTTATTKTKTTTDAVL